jgi:predicted ATPase
MIRSLSLRNFRAYRNQAFQFARLNLFVGPNNSGKSSALSAISFIAQSILQRDVSASPISINGPFEQLGTFLDVVHGNRASTPMGFDLEYENPARRDTHNIKFELKYRSQRREAEISKFSYYQNKREIYAYIARKDSFSVKLSGRMIEAIAPELKKQRPQFGSIFPVDRTLFRYGAPELYPATRTLPKEAQAQLREADRNMRRGRAQLRETFANFDSISPFRDQPERTYLFTGETPSRIGRTGSNGVSLLLNDVSKRGSLKLGFADIISEWLAVTRIASEIVVRPLTERHFEICIRDLDNKIHNICDVGFGCSQVLPVLVGALNILLPGRHRSASSTPTFVVQEPEIHLHPNAQAALGSFFASLAKAKVQIFVETHSDNMILRVASHVASGHIDPQDVAIFYCQNEKGRKTVERLSLDRQGVFHPRWPGGFFPQRENETLKLARARRDQDGETLFNKSGLVYFDE